MKCPKCGKKNDPDDDFCAKCGKKLKKSYTIKSEKTNYTVECPFCEKMFSFEAEEDWESLNVTCPKCKKKTEFYEKDFRSNENKKYGIPALISFFCPGLGQFIKGHIGRGVLMMVGVSVGIILVLQFSFIGVIIIPFVWIWSVYDAYNSN